MTDHGVQENGAAPAGAQRPARQAAELAAHQKDAALRVVLNVREVEQIAALRAENGWLKAGLKLLTEEHSCASNVEEAIAQLRAHMDSLATLSGDKCQQGLLLLNNEVYMAECPEDVRELRDALHPILLIVGRASTALEEMDALVSEFEA